MSAKNQEEFGVNVEKWADLEAAERNKVKKLLKRYACTFTIKSTGTQKHIVGEA